MNYGVIASVLKPLEELTLPDPRIRTEWHKPEPARDLSAADIRQRLEETASLHPGVPKRVRNQFEVARNLMLYTYFVFEFQTQAELQAYATLELALRERLGRPTRKNKQGKEIKALPLMLKELLQMAMDEKLVQPEEFPSFKRTNLLRQGAAEQRGYAFEPISAADWMATVQEFIIGQRNHLAHGNPHLDFPLSFNQIQRCADIINALFPKPDEKTTQPT